MNHISVSREWGKEASVGSGEVSQGSKTLVVLAGYQCSVPSIHTEAHNCL